jgi:hypothetical protein
MQIERMYFFCDTNRINSLYVTYYFLWSLNDFEAITQKSIVAFRQSIKIFQNYVKHSIILLVILNRDQIGNNEE